MNIAQIIQSKRDGGRLSDAEIAFLIDGYARDEVPDYQVAAFAMAVYFQGLDEGETATLTERMLRSGTTLTWRDTSHPVVDKHSTGGIGDKISLVLAPLLACCGVRVPMISGRGLGATGGTLDKLESLAGFRTDLTREEIQAQADRVGCVVSGATADIAPADKKLYALRDVTATVPSVPLITASIMSKKLAESLDALVLDVKFGSGAFMKTLPDARRLAESLVATGRRMGVPTVALLTDMNQPLGRGVGNALEVAEAIECLRGEGPADVVDLTVTLGAELLALAGRGSAEQAEGLLRERLASGVGLEKFREMVAAQGGHPELALEFAPSRPYAASAGGYLTRIDAERLGRIVIALGGGRRRLGDPIDHAVGLEMLARLGDRVEPGQPLLHVFARQPIDAALRRMLDDAVEIGPEPIERPRLLRERIAG